MSIFSEDPRDLRLTLNGFPLYGVDEYESEWHVTFQDVSGLFDGVASTLKTDGKILSDGWYGNIPRLQGRTISIDGYIIGRCTEACVRSWDAFKSGMTVSDMRLVVELGSIKRQLQVVQSASAPLIKWDGVNILKFTLGLTSLDSYLYGVKLKSGSTGLPRSDGGLTMPYRFEDASSLMMSEWSWSERIVSGQVRLTNTGTAPSPVFIRVDGPVEKPQVLHVGSGHALTLATTLGIGHYVTFNGLTHEVLVDGTDPARSRVIRREWSEATPGENTWAFSSSGLSDTAKMTVSFYPAYL